MELLDAQFRLDNDMILILIQIQTQTVNPRSSYL